MEFIKFEQCNFVFGRPVNTTEEQCGGLDVFKGKDPDGLDIIVSCVHLEDEDLEIMNKTKSVWVFHMGNYLQPHSLSALNPFSEEIHLPVPAKALTEGQIEMLAQLLAHSVEKFPKPEEMKLRDEDGNTIYNGAYVWFKGFLSILKNNLPE